LLGGAAAKSVGTATLLKGAATVMVAAAIGVGAADRGGLIRIGNHDPTPAVQSGTGDGGRPSSNAATPPSKASGVDSANGSSAKRRLQNSVAAARPRFQVPGHARAKGAGPAPHNTSASNENAGSASPGKSGVEHPHGQGHTKQTPAAATHGQGTAAGNKPEKVTGSSGASKSGGSKPARDPRPVPPPHPSHPAEPAKPAGSANAGPAPKPEGEQPK
jgi:hypothetical protein